MPLDRRTRATLRSAEFGFLGVWVNTRVHTPRRWGAPLSAGVFAFAVFDWRPLRTNCWMVGTRNLANDDRRDCQGESGVDAHTRQRPTGHPTGGRARAATCEADTHRSEPRRSDVRL